MMNFDAVEIPKNFTGPITLELMDDPVVAADGFSYEREAIQRWLSSGHRNSPMTGEVLKHTTLTPNFTLRSQINEFREKLSDLQCKKANENIIQEGIKLREEFIKELLKKQKLVEKEINNMEENNFKKPSLYYTVPKEATTSQVQQYLSHLKDNKIVTALDISNVQLEEKNVIFLCELLRRNKKIIFVSLKNTNLGDKEAKIICDLLIANTVLQHLDLSNNNLTNTGMRILHDAWQKNSGLTLNLKGNKRFCNVNELQVGDVLLKYNDKTIGNETIIFGNKINQFLHGKKNYTEIAHAAIYIGNDEIIEAVPTGLVRTNLQDNNYQYEIFRYDADQRIAKCAADMAFSLYHACIEESEVRGIFAKLMYAKTGMYNWKVLLTPFLRTSEIEPKKIEEIAQNFDLQGQRYYCSELVVFVYSLAAQIKAVQKVSPVFPIDTGYKNILPVVLYHVIKQDANWDYIGQITTKNLYLDRDVDYGLNYNRIWVSEKGVNSSNSIGMSSVEAQPKHFVSNEPRGELSKRDEFSKQANKHYVLAKAAIFKKQYSQAIDLLFLAKSEYKKLQKKHGLDFSKRLKQINLKLESLADKPVKQVGVTQKFEETQEQKANDVRLSQPKPQSSSSANKGVTSWKFSEVPFYKPKRKHRSSDEKISQSKPQHFKSTVTGIETAQMQSFSTEKLHTKEIWSSVVLPGKKFVTGSYDTYLVLWNQASGVNIKLNGHNKEIRALVELPQNKFASGSHDKTIKIWDIDTGKCLRTLVGHTHEIWVIDVFPDGRLLSGSTDGTVKIWNSLSGECLQTFVSGNVGMQVRSLAVMDNYRFACGGTNKTVQIWDVSSGKCMHNLACANTNVMALIMLPDGNLVSGSDDAIIRIWNPNTGECLRKLEGHKDQIRCFAVTKDNVLISGTRDKVVKFWDLNSGKCIKTVNYGATVSTMNILQTGELMLGGGDAEVKLWKFLEVLLHRFARKFEVRENAEYKKEIDVERRKPLLLKENITPKVVDPVKLWTNAACREQSLSAEPNKPAIIQNLFWDGSKIITDSVLVHAASNQAYQVIKKDGSFVLLDLWTQNEVLKGETPRGKNPGFSLRNEGRYLCILAQISSDNWNRASHWLNIWDIEAKKIIFVQNGIYLNHLDTYNDYLIIKHKELFRGHSMKSNQKITVYDIRSQKLVKTLELPIDIHQTETCVSLARKENKLFFANHLGMGQIWDLDTISKVADFRSQNADCGIRTILEDRIILNTQRVISRSSRGVQAELCMEIIDYSGKHHGCIDRAHYIGAVNGLMIKEKLYRNLMAIIIPYKDHDHEMQLWDVDNRVRLVSPKEFNIYNFRSGYCYFQAHNNLLLMHERSNHQGGGVYDETLRVWDMNALECICNIGKEKLAGKYLRFRTGEELKTGEVFYTSAEKTSDFKLLKFANPELKHSINITGEGFFKPAQNAKQHFDFACRKTLTGHSSAILWLATLPNDRLASSAQDNTIKIWNMTNGKCIKTLVGHATHVNCITVLPSGLLASASDDKTIKIWDIEKEQCVKTLIGHEDGLLFLMNLPNGLLGSSSRDHTIKFWDVNSGRCVKTLTGHSYWVRSFAILSENLLVSASADKTIKVWEISTGKCTKTITGHTDAVGWVTVLPNGKLVSASDDKTLKVWDVEQGKCIKTLMGHTSYVGNPTILPNGLLASRSGDKTIKIWDVDSGKCVKTLTDHSAPVRFITCTPTGLLLSASEDKTIKIWQSSEEPTNMVSYKFY